MRTLDTHPAEHSQSHTLWTLGPPTYPPSPNLSPTSPRLSSALILSDQSVPKAIPPSPNLSPRRSTPIPGHSPRRTTPSPIFNTNTNSLDPLVSNNPYQPISLPEDDNSGTAPNTDVEMTPAILEEKGVNPDSPKNKHQDHRNKKKAKKKHKTQATGNTTPAPSIRSHKETAKGRRKRQEEGPTS